MTGTVLLVLRLLLAISLFAFIVWALLIIWRDVQYQGALLAARRTPPIHLLFQQGKRSPQVRHFTIPIITLGRDPACDCALDDDTVSSLHARLSFHHNQWWLEDLQSTNGTKLNDELVKTPTVVISGDEIQCGSVVMTISLSSEALNPPTRPQTLE